jgi:hypothetical protein
MANGRTPIDLGFADFAAQVLAELQEGVDSAQNEQETRRAALAERAAMTVSQFARRFVADEDVDAELSRLFPAAGMKGTAIVAGRSYRAAGAKRAEAPAIENKLRIKLGARDLRTRGGRSTLTARGVAGVREAVRLRLSEARLKALRQTVTQGLPRVVVDSGRVNVKLSFRLVDLNKLAATPNAAIAPLKSLTNTAGKGDRVKQLRLIVRQVNDDTAPATVSGPSGIGELDLTFKTV